MIIVGNTWLITHIIKRRNRMAINKPVNIKRITLEYENGTKLVVNETKIPTIGKLFFDSVNSHDEIKWQVLEKGNVITKFIQKCKEYFTI